MKSKKITAPKYPRVMVSPARHSALLKESQLKKISIAQLAEQKFVKASK